MRALGKFRPYGCILHGVGYLALALALGGWTARMTLEACDGELIPPLDDTYIYLQYARAAGQGEPLVYQPGAEPTRGATSLLYPLLLAPASRVLSSAHLPWAAWALGVLFLAGSTLAADRWATRRLGGPAGWMTGGLVLLSGHLLWGAVSGMDIALYALTLTAAVAAVPWYLEARDPEAGVRRLGALAVILALLGLARPEGILVGGVVACGVPLARSAPNSRRARWILVLGPLFAAAATLAVNLAALGEPASNTLAAKAVWSEPRPDVREDMVRRIPWISLRIGRALVSDFFSPAWGHGTRYLLEGILAAGAVAGLLAAAFRTRRAGDRVLAVALLAGLLTCLVPAGFHSHHYRYEIPYVPLVTLLVVLGWATLIPARAGWRVRGIPLLLAAGLLLPGLWRFAHMVPRNASNIRDHQVAAGRWIRDHLPGDAVVGINDAGAIAYFGERRIVDLVGLVTNGPARPNRAGPASLFEWLEGLPPGERPTHFAIFPDWFPYLRRTSLVGEKLAQFVLGDNTISGADLKAVYRARWSAVGPAEEVWVRRDLIDLWGFRVMDRLDVADLENQDAHGYEAFDTWRDTLREFPVEGNPGRVLIDGGRQPTRGERFRLRCRPGEPAALVMRTEAYLEFALEVRVNGRDLGTWTVPRASLVWTEPLFEIPGDALTTDPVQVELILPDGAPPYPSFHYWLLQ